MHVTHTTGMGKQLDIEQITAPEPAVDEEAVGAELEAYVSGTEPDTTKPAFEIEHLGQANWAMRQLAAAESIDREYADQIALWTDARKRTARAILFFKDLLEAWGIRSRSKDAKTFVLAHGTVSTRQGKAKLQIDDDDAALEWAKKNLPAAVKTTEEVMISWLGEAVQIGSLVVGYESVQTSTGNVDQVMLAEPTIFAQAPLDTLRERLGEGFTVEPIYDLFAVDKDGNPVPGMSVKPARVTATVTPLGL